MARISACWGQCSAVGMDMAGQLRNNLDQQLARYTSSVSASTPLSCHKKKTFTFQKVNKSQPSNAAFPSQPKVFNPPFSSNFIATPQQQRSFNTPNNVPPVGIIKSFSSNSIATSQQQQHTPAAKNGKITKFFGGPSPTPHFSPPVAFVAPVKNTTTSQKSTELPSNPGKVTTENHTLPPGAHLASSVSFTSPTTPLSPQVPVSKAELKQKLEELHSERVRVMDDVCDLLSDVPASNISSLFGVGAGHLQRKLAVRKQLLSKEQEVRRQIVTLDSVPKGNNTWGCTNSVPSHSSASTAAVPNTWQGSDDWRYTNSMAPQSSHSSTSTATADFAGPEEKENWDIPDEIFEQMVCEEDAANCQSYLDGGMDSHATITTLRPPTSAPLVTHPSNSRVPSRPPLNQSLFKPSTGRMPDDANQFCGPYPHSQELMKVFTQVFGLRQFRSNQLEAINAAILGEDCFVLMPTGGGKSLCYQLPALMTPGVTVVVSPLRSLIQDQVQKLCSLEIPANHLSSDITLSEESRVYATLCLREPTTRLLYVTPEKLGASNKLLSTLQGLYTRQRLARFVIDEAHCISQWGHDFRPDYKRLSELRQKFPGVPVIALTATATPRVRADILHQLHLNNTKWFTQSFNRTNLFYTVLPKKVKKVTQDIVDLISNSFRNQSGIVYCLSRRDCELMSSELCKAGLSALCYHAGLSDEERVTAQQRWVQEDRCKVVCATIAFGMGIDKPDVRFVIHHSLPKSMEGYYQEAGRAGRDGLPASCFLFYNYSDMARYRRMVRSEGLHPAQEKVHLDNLYRMVQYCENEADCRRVQLLEYFAEKFDSSLCKDGSTPCDNCQSKVPFCSQDVTEMVKIIVHSVQSVRKDQFTLVQYVDALKGSTSNRVLQSELASLPLYRKGGDYAKHDLERLLHMLVLKDILKENLHIGNHDNVICYVKTGSKARDVLAGNTGRFTLKTRGKSTAVANSKNSRKSNSKEDLIKEQCYKALLSLRITMAQQCKVKNPENLFTADTLRVMSHVLPTNREEMMGVVGMTEVKWKNFNGEGFLKTTQEYAAKMPKVKSPYWEAGTKAPLVSKGKRKSRESLGAPRSKKPALVRNVDSGDEFEPLPVIPSRKPGILPPPVPMKSVK